MSAQSADPRKKPRPAARPWTSYAARMSDPNAPDGVNASSPDARPFSPVCLSCGFPRKGLGDSITTCPECGAGWVRLCDGGSWLRDVTWGLKLVALGLAAWFVFGAFSVPPGSLRDALQFASAAALLTVWLGTRRLIPVAPHGPAVRAASVAITALLVMYIAVCTDVFGVLGSSVWGLTASRIDLRFDLLSSSVLKALEATAGAGLVVILFSLATNLRIRVRLKLSDWLVLAVGLLAGVGRPFSANLHQLLDYFFGMASTESAQVLRGLADSYLELFVTASTLGIVLAIWVLWLVCARAASQATSHAVHGNQCDRPAS